MDLVISILKRKDASRLHYGFMRQTNEQEDFMKNVVLDLMALKKHSHFSNKPVELRYIKQI